MYTECERQTEEALAIRLLALHENRMLEKYRNSRPKANKATERKGDFVDANSTHFSAMAMSATFAQGIEGDMSTGDGLSRKGGTERHRRDCNGVKERASKRES